LAKAVSVVTQLSNNLLKIYNLLTERRKPKTENGIIDKLRESIYF